MVYLTIKATEQSRAELKKFEVLIDTWEFKIVQREYNQELSIVKLAINAATPAAMNMMVSIAQSRFQADLLESNMKYEPDKPPYLNI